MERTIPPRPTWNNEMTKELAKFAGDLVHKWCNDETPLEECVEISEEILKWNLHSDGYELAKEYEDKGFDADSMLVEELDTISYHEDKIAEKYVRRWVEENNLKLELEVGDIVSAELHFKGSIVGEIVELYPNTMQYGVWYEGQGSEKGKGHTIIDAEKVTKKK